MTDNLSNNNQGCLGAIFRLFPSLGNDKKTEQVLPYARRDDFLSAAEHSFYMVLKSLVMDYFAICPKVSLSDIFFVKSGGNKGDSMTYLNKINRKHVDFLICKPDTMQPVLGIELDDSSHRRTDRAARDLFVDDVFSAAGLPILHIPVARTYDSKELARMLKPHLASKTEDAASQVAPVSVPPKATESVHIEADGDGKVCPKCGGEMTIRIARQGPNAGRQFYGCSNFPKCKMVLPVEG